MANPSQEVRLCWKTTVGMLVGVFGPEPIRWAMDPQALNIWLDAVLKLGQIVVAATTAIYFIRKTFYAKSKKRASRRHARAQSRRLQHHTEES